MFCPKCGANLPEGSVFCPSCGFNLAGGFDSPAENVVYPLDKAKKTLSDPLFLAIAILLSASVVAGFLTGGFNILLAIIVVGVWMAYAGATGENTGLIGNGISIASVCVKIQYIITYVVSGILLFCGVIIFVILSVIGNALGDIASFTYETFEQTAAEMGLFLEVNPEAADILDRLFSVIGSLSGVALGMIFFIVTLICAGFAILFNILFTRRFSKFLSGANRAVKEGRTVELGDRRCATWLLVYGIIMAIDAVSTFATTANIFVLISSGCVAASCIMASVMMKKEV